MHETKKIILPYELNVESIAYQSQAFPLGIIKANIPDYDCWLCNKCINFYITADYKFYSIYEEDLWSCQDELMTCRKKKFASESFYLVCLKIVEENKNMLDNGWYIFGIYNEFFIPRKKVYHKRDFMHGYIIFGYDDETQTFKSAGYLDDGHYQFFDIRYEDYFNSILGGTIEQLWITYYKINHNYRPQLDINQLKSRIEKYLTSQKDTYAENDNRTYGMAALEMFHQYIASCNNDYLDLRYGRSYMEHKCIMYKRLAFLYQNAYIHDDAICQEYFDKVCSKARIVFNLFLKYKITQDRNLLKHISEMVEQINREEKALLQHFIELR